MTGESCVPSIETRDFESIFEEEEVVRDLDIDANPLRRVFVQSANTFSFGAIIPGAHPKGVEARLKITNSSKVRSTIEFAVNGDESADVFSVVPSKPQTEV